jgi:hypothetical protein
MRKGSLVRVRGDTRYEAFRTLTTEERVAWRVKFEEDVAAGLRVPFDSGGESVLPPTTGGVSTSEDKYYIVMRTRCRAQRNYHTVKGLCELLDPETGVKFYLKRERILSVEGT